ncbi:MAG TPA: hypothetical protein VF432_19255 [Thermoanaerobaculia bacterium]
MIRKLLLAVTLFATAATDAWAECKPRWSLASVGVTSHARWRALELGDGLFINPQFELGLCGRPISATGVHGLDVTAEAWMPLDSDEVDMASAQLRYRRHFASYSDPEVGESDDAESEEETHDLESWIGAGLTQYHWGRGEEWSSEVSVEVFWKVTKRTFTFWPYAQVAHDFQKFEGTYARGGVFHRVGFQETFADLDVSMSASDYADKFGYYATEASGWFHWPLPKLRGRDFGVEFGGGYVWAAQEIARGDGGWVGARVKMTQ